MPTAKPETLQTRDVVAAAVESWIREKLANSDFSTNTAAWNRLSDAKSDLVDRITQLFNQGA